MRLKEWREGAGRSAADVAEALGCTRQAVAKWEAGSLPVQPMLEAIGALSRGAVTPNDWFDVDRWREAPASTVGAPSAKAR